MKKFKLSQAVEAVPDFPELERQMLGIWEEEDIIRKYLARNQNSRNYFSFLDGPITANNPMGVHHAWGRTYKDLWQRFFNMRGDKQRFQNGFDAQGLWVEVEVEKELGFTSKKDIQRYGVAKFVKRCKERVRKYATIQTEQSKRLGYFMDWSHSYYTHSDENNYMIWHFLKVCHENGWLYKGLDSVPWCPRCETAISQHEMLSEDYKEVVHESIYLALPIRKRHEYLLVWTTTPWTIPANIAVAVDQKLDYALVRVSERGYWVARDVVERVFAHREHKVEKVMKGKELVGLRYWAPFDRLPAVRKVAKTHPQTFHTVVASDTHILPITTSEGTGLVHTAVSAGSEDFKLGKKMGLPMIPVIHDDASYLPGMGELTGKNAKQHPEVVLDRIRDWDRQPGQHWVFSIENYQHRYPACWRCKTELVWKVTDEWYIAMDKPSSAKRKAQSAKGQTLRERMMKVAKKIQWIPSFGLDRELDWLKNMQDWLISKKNRYWGLCLPIWLCNKCGDFDVIGSKEELRERAVEGWKQFERKSPHKPQIDRVKIRCSTCGEITTRIEPVGNPWLDAGIVPFSTVTSNNRGAPLYQTNRRRWKNWYPADFITESFPGQFKNWFYSLIAMATVLENEEPVRTVLGFATLLGEDGRPMHKSWGNAIEFNDGADSIGVDVMRWMYARQDPQQNLWFGFNTAAEVRRHFHLILWNAYRFVVSSLALEADLVKRSTRRTVLDRWILSRLEGSLEQVTESLERFDAQKACLNLEEFVHDFSTWYIRRSRDRVGPASEDPSARRVFYATAIEVLTTLSKILAPFVPFMADAIYRNLTDNRSVHLADWPPLTKRYLDTGLERQMDWIRLAAEKVHATRREAGIKIRQPLPGVTITVSPEDQGVDPGLLDLLKAEVNVKSVTWTKGSIEGLHVDLDTTVTKELLAEGQARELIRVIQSKRKQLGIQRMEKVIVTLPMIPRGFEEEIRKRTGAASLKKGHTMRVQKVGTNGSVKKREDA